MSVERKEKIVSKTDGVKYVRNTYVDSKREYSKAQAGKRKGMLDTYSIESQLNAMRKAILNLSAQSNVAQPELQAIEDLATELGIK